MTAFAEIIKKTGMSVSDFAKAFNIPYNTVSSWVRGERKPPDYVVELIEYKIIKEEMSMRYKVEIHDNNSRTAIVVYHYDEEIPYHTGICMCFGFM
jgi:predicted transcriptional regulator